MVNSAWPSPSGTRKSSSLWMIRVGVLKFAAYLLGEYLSKSAVAQGWPCSQSSNHTSSVVPYIVVKSYTPSWLTMHLNLSVWPLSQFIM